jgi:hypothetical protein
MTNIVKIDTLALLFNGLMLYFAAGRNAKSAPEENPCFSNTPPSPLSS